MKKGLKILLVEDDRYYCETLKKHLANHISTAYPEIKFEIKGSLSAQSCLESLEKDTNIVLLDYYLEDDFGEVVFPGIDLLQAINCYCMDCKVVVVSGQTDEKIAVELIRNGIYDYIVKGHDTLIRLSSVLDRIIKEFKAKESV